MHKLGTSMTTQLLPGGGGTASDLGTIPAWSFNTQAWLEIGKSGAGGAVVSQGDTIKTTCAYKNTTGANVKYGQNTADEMCYSFTTYYPRINSSLWSWAAPAIASTCQ